MPDTVSTDVSAGRHWPWHPPPSPPYCDGPIQFADPSDPAATTLDWPLPSPPNPRPRAAQPRSGVPKAMAAIAAVVTVFFLSFSIARVLQPASSTHANVAPTVPSTAPSTSPPTTKPTPSTAAPSTTAPPSTTPSTPSTRATPPTTSGSTTTNDFSAVATAIEPSVVDIVSLLPDGVGAGTGIIISASGDVLTNNHVIEGAEQIQVTRVTTGDVYSGTVVGTDPVHDVAVVHLAAASNLPVAPLGDSDGVEVDDPIAAIGNAGGRGGLPTVAPGSVTALHQRVTASDLDGSNIRTLTDLIQVDANVQPGDSGGPLVSEDARVIGIDVAASVSRSRRGSQTHEGFAIPINTAMKIAKQIEANPSPPSTTPGTPALGSGYLGVQIDLNATDDGATVKSVQSGGPADKAGIKAGDVITAVDGTDVTVPSDLTNVLKAHKGGDAVSITWQSSDGTHTTAVTLASR